MKNKYVEHNRAKNRRKTESIGIQRARRIEPTRRRIRDTQGWREASPGIASPAAFLAERTDLQFPPETVRHSALCIQPESTADSLG